MTYTFGQSLKDVNLRQNYGVWVIGTKSADKEGTSLPEPDYVFHDDDTLLVVGKEKAIERLQAIE